MDQPRRLTTYQRTSLTNGAAASAQAAAQYRLDGHPDLAAELDDLAEHTRRVLALTEAASVQEPSAPRLNPAAVAFDEVADDDGEVA